jgi:hypothetical protein
MEVGQGPNWGASAKEKTDRNAKVNEGCRWRRGILEHSLSFGHTSTVTMDVAFPFETLVTIYWTTRRHIPEDSNLHSHWCENLTKQRTVELLFIEQRCQQWGGKVGKGVQFTACWQSEGVGDCIHCSVPPWSRISLEKAIVAQLVKKLPQFFEPESSLPCSQKPTSGPYH